jgi:hypothetical protein
MRERTAAVRYLRAQGETVLADALERGEHRPHRRYTGTADHWPCGHARTDENTVRVGRENGVRCRTCRREIQAKYYQRLKERATCGGG